MIAFTATFWMLIVLVLGLLAVLLFAGMILLPYAGAWLLGQKLRRMTDQRDSRNEPIDQGALARTGIGVLPADMALLARVGGNVAPEQGFNEIILRPTRGLRIISIAASALVIFEVIRRWDSLFGDGLLAPAALALLLLYAAAHTFSYELRYDAEGFTSRDALFRARRIAWRDVVRLTDNGHYLYHFRLTSGGKVDVPKYLVGIRDFLTYAKDQMRYHDRL